MNQNFKPEALIRTTFSSINKAHFSIRKKKLDRTSLNQKLFLDTIEKLIQIDQRRDYLLENIGIDVTAFEDVYFHIIENLFNLCFNKKQLQLLRTYLYELYPNDEWDGYANVIIDGEKQKVHIKTPKQVWDILQKIK